MKHVTGTVFAVVMATLTLVGCGGSGGESASNSGNPALGPGANPTAQESVSVVGRIDAFGSVFVGGIEFETAGTTYRIDDEDGFQESALSVGMIVRVEGSASADGRRGKADRIHYDDEVEGLVAALEVDPADATIKRFTILGTMIVASAATTVFKGEGDAPYSFDDLAVGDHVEVSGDFEGDVLIASFIEREDDEDEDFEVKGTVSAFDGTSFTLTLRNGATLTVTFAADARIPASGIEDGQFVEVKGTVPDPVNAPMALLATRVEVEHKHDFDGEQHRGRSLRVKGMLELEGDIWSVRGTQLRFDAETDYRPASLAAAIADASAAGRRVKVEGVGVEGEDGVLLVRRIKAHLDDDLKIKGIFESVTTDAATGVSTVVVSFPPAVGTVSVRVGPETLLKNDDAMAGFEFGNLMAGVSFVEANGYLDDDGAFVATVFEHEDDGDEYEIEGPLDVDGFEENVSITVLGVTFLLDAETEYDDREDDDGPPPSEGFVELEDEDLDGTADSVEFKGGF